MITQIIKLRTIIAAPPAIPTIVLVLEGDVFSLENLQVFSAMIMTLKRANWHPL